MDKPRTIYGVEIFLAEGVDYEADVVPAIAELSSAARSTPKIVIDYLKDIGLILRSGRDLNLPAP